MSPNVPAYAMFVSGIIARSAYHWQIWVEACGGTEQAVTAYAVLCDVTKSKGAIAPLYFGKFILHHMANLRHILQPF